MNFIKGPPAPGCLVPESGKGEAYAGPPSRVGGGRQALVAVAARRPHMACLWRSPTDVIHQFSVAPNVSTAMRLCALGRLFALRRSSHSCSKPEHLREMEGETAIDSELRGLQFG